MAGITETFIELWKHRNIILETLLSPCCWDKSSLTVWKYCSPQLSSGFHQHITPEYQVQLSFAIAKNFNNSLPFDGLSLHSGVLRTGGRDRVQRTELQKSTKSLDGNRVICAAIWHSVIFLPRRGKKSSNNEFRCFEEEIVLYSEYINAPYLSCQSAAGF